LNSSSLLQVICILQLQGVITKQQMNVNWWYKKPKII